MPDPEPPVPLVTADEIHEHVETDRSPEAIALLVADAEAAVVARYGPHAPAEIELDLFGGATTIYLDRPAASVATATEFAGSPFSASETELDPEDYRILHGGRALQRLASGTHPAVEWGGRVVLSYIPVDDTPQRKRVIIDLVKLALRYDAAKAQSTGSTSETALDDYTRERANLLDELGSPVGFS